MARTARTIIDLAEVLGLSKTTVADALRGSGRVSEATRARVQQAATQLGYVSNRAARQLRTRTSETMGLYISPDVRNMPFYMPFAFGVADAAATFGYDLTLISRASANADSWSNLGGAIVIDALAGDHIVESLVTSPIPVVSAGRTAVDLGSTISAVVEIEYTTMFQVLLDRLQSCGATRPALLAPESRASTSWSQLIRDGYTTWCDNHGLAPTIVSLPPYPTNNELEIALNVATREPDVDGLLFGWHEIADRADVLLTRTGRHEQFHLATLTSSSFEHPNSPYDVVMDLRPHEFGEEVAAVLRTVIEDPGAPPIARVHEVEIRSHHPTTLAGPRT